MKKRTGFFVLLSWVLFSCEPHRVDNEAVVQENMDRKIVQILPGDMMEIARALAEKAYAAHQPDSVTEGGSVFLDAEYMIFAREPDSKCLTEKEQAILEAYNEAAKRSTTEIPVNTMKASDTLWLYTKPYMQKQEYKGMWAVYVSQKAVIRAYQESKKKK